MAPEQARGEVAALDERCDVFALGSILCEVLTGAPAFTGRHVGEVQRRAARAELSDAFARLEACGSDPELVGLAEACLAAEREDRPDDASAVAGRLSAHQESVHRRMREAELAHAAEGARVDEAKKTAIAEAMRAEAAEARARAERQARRSLLGLAAAVLALTVMGARGRPGRSSSSATAPPRSRSPCATPPSSATRRKRRPATPGGGRPPRRP